MAGRKRKRRGALAALMDGLLTLVDRLCEGVGALAAALGRALLALLRLIARGLLALVRLLARIAALPFRAIARAAGRRAGAARQCDRLTGEEFERYVALVLRDNGFRDVELTRASGDQGVDILADREGKRYAIQCKNYAGAVGNAAVQEAYAGAQFYGCDVAAVICPGDFTPAARELARATGVRLWDGRRLTHMMRVSGRRPREGKLKKE